MNQKLDLIKKHSKTSTAKPPSPDSSKRGGGNVQWGEKAILFGIPLGFVVVLLVLFGDRLIPAQEVEVINILLVEAEAGTTVSTEQAANDSPDNDLRGLEVLFQASGWFEADPYPHRAVALVNGVIDEVMILEGESVIKGQLLATLIEDDALLEREAAHFEYQRALSELDAQRHRMATAVADLQTLEANIKIQVAKFDEVKDIADRKRILGKGVLSEEDLKQAILKENTQLAILEALKTEQVQANARVGMEDANLRSIEAYLGLMKNKLAQKELALERTSIRSPIDGIVQSLRAAPGQKKMSQSDHPESLTVAVIFDPSKLQARIDVPLEEASRLHIGQLARVRTSLLANQWFQGTVTQISGESDIQRNTLQVKVSIREPDTRLRPEMLCRAEFLESGHNDNASQKQTSQRLFIPESTVLKRSGNQATVFRLNDSRNRLVETSVQLMGDLEDGFYPVASGIRAGEQLVKNPTDRFKHNQRVRISQ